MRKNKCLGSLLGLVKLYSAVGTEKNPRVQLRNYKSDKIFYDTRLFVIDHPYLAFL